MVEAQVQQVAKLTHQPQLGGEALQMKPQKLRRGRRELIMGVLIHMLVTIPIIIFSLVLHIWNYLCSVFSLFP